MPLRLSTTLNGELRQWLLERSPVNLGRASGNTIQLLDGTVSKEHAEFNLADGRWTVRDLGSRNGTRVNGRDAQSPLPLAAGDRVEIGHVLLTVSEPKSDDATRFSTSEHVGSSLKIKVSDVLQGPTGSVAAGASVLHVLVEAGQMLVVQRSLEETCDAILSLVEAAVPTSRLVILLRDPRAPVDAGPDALRQVAARYRGGRAEEPLALSQTIIKTVLAENTAVITGDATNDPRFLSQKSIIAHAIHSAMAVPLFDNQQVLGILYADSSDPLVTYGQSELELLTLLANMAAVKITNVRLAEAEEVRRRLAHEMATATRIQQNLLPEPPDIRGWSCHARLESCYEVGGDLYDLYLREDGTLVLVVGDVTGKGVGAALLMANVLASSRALYEECEGPVQLVRRLNRNVYRDTDERSYVTMFVGWLDTASGCLRYVNAGHPEPHLVHSGELRLLGTTGTFVGMFEDKDWTQGEIVIAPGETLAVYTDGIPDTARNKDDHGRVLDPPEFLDMERTTPILVAAASEPDLVKVSDRVIAKIDAFAAGFPRTDDVTLLLLRRE